MLNSYASGSKKGPEIGKEKPHYCALTPRYTLYFPALKHFKNAALLAIGNLWMPHMHVKVSVFLRRVGPQKLIANDDF